MNGFKPRLFVIVPIFVSFCSHATTISFGQTQTGTISSAAQTNSYTFVANPNDVVDFTMVATSGNLSPKIRLYNPVGTQIGTAYNGNPYGCAGGSTIELNTATLTLAGTYTVLVGDCPDTNTGNYSIYMQRTNNPAGAAALAFGQTQTGTIGSAAQSNSYTFSANASDVIDFTVVTTSGNLSPKLRLYNPAGAQVSIAYNGNPYGCAGGSTIEMNTVTLAAAGTYTVLFGDCGDTQTGNYSIYVQRTNNPSGAAKLSFSGQAQTGTINSAAQSSSYVFSGSVNDVLDFTMVATSGSLSPKMRLYNQAGAQVGIAYNGNPYGCAGGSTIELNNVKLPATGTYTMLVGDCGDTSTGNYNLSSQCVGVCPTHPYVFNDFVGNGLSGALLYDSSNGQSYTALSNSNGTYSYVPNLFTANFNILRTGDFNGDGKADLILYNSQTAAAYIGFGNGDGTFTFQSLFWSPGYDTVVTSDFNGDGKTDVGLYNSATGTLYTGISNGDGTFTYEYHLVSQGFTFVHPGNFNGNGKAGLFLYRSSDGLAYLGVGDGTGAFTFNPLSISSGYNLSDNADLNGDGKTDIILYNATTGNAATGISNGSGGFTFTPLVFSPGFTSVRLAKYTGSATADVTVYNKNTALAYFGTGTGTGNFNFQSLFWSPGYDYVVPEDVNGDGRIDIVLYNSTTGTDYTGLSNGNGTFNYTYSYWGIGKLLAQ